MGMSNYLEEQIGGFLFRDGTFTKPTTLYFGLLTTLPTADDGTGLVECAGTYYDRVLYGPSDLHWSAPVDGNGQYANLFSIIFPKPPSIAEGPPEGWGTIVGWALWDDSLANGGNYLISAPLGSNKNVPAGAPAPEFNPGAIKFTLD